MGGRLAARRSAAISGRFIAGALVLAANLAAQPANQAAALIRDGKAAEAIPLLEKATEQSPSDLRAHNLLGIALSNAGRREEAVAEFRRVLDRDPRFLPALKNLAMVELQLGWDSDARTHFELALEAAPEDRSLYFGMGQLAYRSRRFTQAIAYFERSGELYRQDPNTLAQYAESCIAAGQAEKVAAARFEAGLLLAVQQKYSDAAVQFALALKYGADRYESGFNLTLAYFNARNYAAAVEAGSGLVSQNRATTELYSLLAKAYEALGRTAEAYESLRVATRLDPREEAPYLELIDLCVAHENYDLALEIAEIGLRLNPAASRMRVDRGVVLALSGRMEEAEREFAKAGAGVARSIALMEMGRLAEATELLRGLNKDDYLVQWHLAEVLIRFGASEAEAIGALRRSIQLNPSVARTHFLLGKLLGSTGEAAQELEAALRLEPNYVPALYLLAQVYRKNGDAERSAALFAKVTQAKSEAAEKQAAQGALLRIIRDGARSKQ